ncbi:MULTISPECIES: restriction endonuclease subunit S [unclassified Halomonas]|uniref:restriction endonuclease subunit S n=1 Tax=unclassified Halomonas TaxID=2609666 RepID=UPI0005FCCA7F|nr:MULTISPECIES: restriction endonuclease subunit S [unclassified Halomonas]CEP33694.1 Restriction modification system DNA specificity domain-containing protein [Halomonas sp. R57-5]
MMEVSIPDEWAVIEYGDVLTSVSNGIGGKQNKDGSGIPVSRIETIAHETINFSRVGFIEIYDTNKVEKYKINKGDILFSHINSPTHLGKTAIFDKNRELYHGINLLRLVVNKKCMIARFFNYHCKFSRKAGIFSQNAQHAVNQSSINQKKLSRFKVPLPPLAEQKIIADKLDTLLAQVDNTKARLEPIPKILKRFRQSVLAGAMSGRLTKEWRATNHQNIGDVKPLSVAGKIIAGQSPSRSEVNFDGKGEPYVTGPEQWDGRKILHNKWTEYPKRMAPDGSIFVTVKGAGVGTTFPGCYAAIGRDVYAFVPNEKMNYTYILFAIQASAADVVLKAKGLIPGLTKSNIIDHEIYLPPLKEQIEIVRRVDRLFAHADRIEHQVNQSLARVNNLTQSILAKAFRGELTEQWRKDNPDLITGENSAEALLERIKAERAVKAPAKRRKRSA